MEACDLEVLAWRLFEESNDAVFLLDADAETIWQANPTAQKITGLPWGQLRGRRLDELVNSEQADRMPKLFSAVRETGYFHSEEEYLLFRQQLEPLPVSLSVSRVHAPPANVGLVVARDISERKRSEKALGCFAEELQRQVTLQTERLRSVNRQLVKEIQQRKGAEQTLQQANHRLREAISQLEHAQEHAIRRERLHALEEIAGGIAHDVNNSLSGLSAFSELILKQDLDEQTHEWAEGIRTSTGDIAAIVRRLRQFCADRPEPHVDECIDLATLAEEVVQLTQPKWLNEALRAGKEIAISVNAEAAPQVIGDTSALRAVLTNLIFNAVDAIENAGTITLRITRQHAAAVLEVIDNGVGMTEEQQRRCLDPFFTTKSDGSGLGLSVCSGIIKSHQGTIEIHAEAGKGTIIKLLLPLPTSTTAVKNSRDAGVAAKDASAETLNGKKILYIDDNQAARTSTAALLTSMGMLVTTAEDGLRGLAMFQQADYDVVMTDMSMPGMDGLQLTSQLKVIDPTASVVVISGWLIDESRFDKSTDRPDCFLSKPLSSEQLTSVLIDLTAEQSSGR